MGNWKWEMGFGKWKLGNGKYKMEKLQLTRSGARRATISGAKRRSLAY
jgi:hypothetical protein